MIALCIRFLHSYLKIRVLFSLTLIKYIPFLGAYSLTKEHRKLLNTQQ